MQDPDERALRQSPYDTADRLELLNLLGLYSHLIDDFDTALWSQLFTEDARFIIHPHPASGPEARPVQWRGRQMLFEVMAPRHVAFRAAGVQRRHFLTNPAVHSQTETTASLMGYFMLMTSEQGGPAEVVGTGRFDGAALKTSEGWKIDEWIFHSDRALDPNEFDDAD